MKFWENFPSKEELLCYEAGQTASPDRHVNAHIHSPYSFSSFSGIPEIAGKALEEDVRILGINDFNTAEGYIPFATECLKKKIFPLFNIEFIGLSRIHQQHKIRINDPNNPGRIYLSGKGLSFPFRMDEPYRSMLEDVRKLANKQTVLMVDKLNEHLADLGVDLQLSWQDIRDDLTLGMVRERHLARALRMEIFERADTDSERRQWLERIFEKDVKSDLNEVAALENEIRSVLLKAGGKAFIAEDPDTFHEVETIRQFILHAGGIPTYPILGDNNNGEYTEFENDRVKLAAQLKEWGYYAVEFISVRNHENQLQSYAEFLVKEGFIVLFGSEHNTPAMTPLKLYTLDNPALNRNLNRINYEGACIVAAHQYLSARYGQGYLDPKGQAVYDSPRELMELGRGIIDYYITRQS